MEATEADEDREAVRMLTGDTCNRAVDREGFAVDDKETMDVALDDTIREPSDKEKKITFNQFSILVSTGLLREAAAILNDTMTAKVAKASLTKRIRVLSISSSDYYSSLSSPDAIELIWN